MRQKIGKKLLLLRPYFREIFPGYKNYIWLDSDTVVQNDDFYFHFIEAIKNKSLFVSSENDISYGIGKQNTNFKRFFDFYKPYGWVYKNNLKFFGKKHAEKVYSNHFLMLEFCLSDKSKFWDNGKKIFKIS